MPEDITYSVRCTEIVQLVMGRDKKIGGCGEAPLPRKLALAGIISCPRCGLEWPLVSIVATRPEAAPRAVAPRAAAPTGERAVRKAEQGRLWE